MFRFLFRRRHGARTPQARDLDNVSVIVGVNGVESTIGCATSPLTDEKPASVHVAVSSRVNSKTKSSSSDTAVASSNVRVLEQKAEPDEKVEEDVVEKLMQNMLSCFDITAIMNAGERFLSDHKSQEVLSLSISEDEDDSTIQSGSELTTEDASASECSGENSKYSFLSSKSSNESSSCSGESSKCSRESTKYSNESESSWSESATNSKRSLQQSVDEDSLLLTAATSRTSDPFGGFSWDIEEKADSLQKKFKLQGLPTASTAESSAHISFAEGSI